MTKQIFYPKYALFICLYAIIFTIIGTSVAKLMDMFFPKYDSKIKKSKIILLVESYSTLERYSIMGCSFKKGASYESIWIWIFIANLPGSDYLVLSRGYLSLCQGMFKWGEKEFWIPTFSFCGVSCSNYFANYAGDIVSRSFRLDASPTVGVFYLLVTTVTPLDCRIAFAGQRLLLSVLR